MQESSLTSPNSRSRYYNPITKIRTLIQNLDAELMQICNQCTIPRANMKSLTEGLTPKLGGDISYKTQFNQGNPNQNHHNSYSANGSFLSSNGNMANNGGNNNNNSGQHISNGAEALSGIQTRTLSNIYRAKVIDAYRNRRIFTVWGNYHTIRRALLRRGWLEKLTPCRYQRLQCLPEETLLQQAKRGNEYEAVAISKIINHFPAFFVWQPKGQRDLFADVLPHRNRVRRGRCLDFSTKVGLIGCAEQAQWYRQDGMCGMSYPRFYRLSNNTEEKTAFIEDFRQTQCRCLIKYLADYIDNPSVVVDEYEGTVPATTVHFAVGQIKKQLSECEHFGLDEKAATPTDTENIEWDTFLANSRSVLHNKQKLKMSTADMLDYLRQCTLPMEKLETKYPDYKWDGHRNLWILKPGYQCRGLGIIIRSSIDEILQWSHNNSNRRYIAQKYIERPLLVYKTKFDIRQYMLLVIGESVVSIWLYKDCYLRFSSQEYTIDDLRECIHLTNNSVQKKYRNKASRDSRLPKSNMWSAEQFKVYLKHQNAPDNVWSEKIFNGFKENLISVVLASMEETDFVENAFELYGCDFMLDEQYNPILIEINSTPDLSASTEVTARICPMVLNDLVKVIIDLPHNARAPTGEFEKVFEINYKTRQDFNPVVGLDVRGKAMKLFKPLHKIIKSHRPAKKSVSRGKSLEDKHRKSKAAVAPVVRRVVSVARPKLTECVDNQKPNKICTKPLQAATKEALALRYAQPK